MERRICKTVSALCLLAIAAIAFTPRVARAQTFTVLHEFHGAGDGYGNQGGLIQIGSDLYGTTFFGGAANNGSGGGYGTIFKYDLNTGTETVLHSFGYPATSDGGEPECTLLQSGSMLFGTTPIGGGGTHSGCIFQYNLNTGSESVSYAFNGGSTDGAQPSGSLIQVGSKLYGVTGAGGPNAPYNGGGTLYQYDPNTGTESVLYSFGPKPGDLNDTNDPAGALLQSGSLLYGAAAGGFDGYGAIYDYNLTSGAENVLYRFSSQNDDGLYPTGTLIRSGDDLYGMTWMGGTGIPYEAPGTVFQYNLDTGVETVLHSFVGSPGDGSYPLGSLVQYGSTLYGMTQYGGADNDGVLFAYDLNTGTETIVHSFTNSSDGANPYGELFVSGNTLYGMSDNALFAVYNIPEPSSLVLAIAACVGIVKRRAKRPTPR